MIEGCNGWVAKSCNGLVAWGVMVAMVAMLAVTWWLEVAVAWWLEVPLWCPGCSDRALIAHGQRTSTPHPAYIFYLSLSILYLLLSLLYVICQAEKGALGNFTV